MATQPNGWTDDGNRLLLMRNQPRPLYSFYSQMTSWSLHVTYSPRGVVWPSSPFVQNIRNRTWTRNLKPFKSILAHALSTLGPYSCADLCRMTFIADERFQSFYVENSGVWTLQIKYVQARDAGIYECQVSTEPKISARVHLHVVGKYFACLYESQSNSWMNRCFRWIPKPMTHFPHCYNYDSFCPPKTHLYPTVHH